MGGSSLAKPTYPLQAQCSHDTPATTGASYRPLLPCTSDGNKSCKRYKKNHTHHTPYNREQVHKPAQSVFTNLMNTQTPKSQEARLRELVLQQHHVVKESYILGTHRMY